MTHHPPISIGAIYEANPSNRQGAIEWTRTKLQTTHVGHIVQSWVVFVQYMKQIDQIGTGLRADTKNIYLT